MPMSPPRGTSAQTIVSSTDALGPSWVPTAQCRPNGPAFPMGGRARDLAAMARPANTRVSLMLFLGAGMSLGLRAPLLAAGAVLIVAIYGISVIINDLRDRQIDLANGHPTPLARDVVNRSQACWLLAGYLAAVAGIEVWLPQPEGLAIAGAWLALAASYSMPGLALEDRGLAGTAMLAICYCITPLYLGASLAGQTPSGFWLVLLAAGLLGASGLLHKDFKDEVGDRLHGKRTPLVRYGPAVVIRLSWCFAASGAAVLLVGAQSKPLVALFLAAAGVALVRISHFRGACPRWSQLYGLTLAVAVVVSR